MEHFLLAIIPSEDIAIKIRNIRKYIFQNFGLVSSQCLPEIIPAAFSRGIIRKELFSDIKLTEVLKTSNEVLIDRQNIFLRIIENDIIDRIAETPGLYISKGFIPTGRGFYIGTNENSLNKAEIINYVSSKSEKILKCKKNNLKLIKITTDNKIWWENIMWETVWNLKIRLKE